MNLGGFVRELRRRNVVRSGLAYIVTAWLAIQAVDILQPAFEFPAWVLQAVVVAAILGFVPVLVFSWFFEITADGILRSEQVPYDELPTHVLGRRFDFVIIAILAAALVLSLYGNVRGPEATQESVSILIADFDNRTGSELFSGVVEESLRVGLEVAPFVDSYSRKAAQSIAARIAGTESGGAILDAETAGIIALRQGIDIVVGGSIERDGAKLVLLATAVSPRDQEQVASIVETADSDVEILAAVANVARQLRRDLGHTDGQTGEGAKESFAVANLEAAAEYLKAQDLQLDRRLDDARVHYRNAIDLDPEFARAYAGLALTEQYLGNAEAASANWKEVLARLDTLTERGQLRTLANYYMINQRNYEQALATYEDLIAKFPGDNVAHNNLAVTSFYAMNFDRALEVGRVVAKRFPDHSGYAANLALFAMYASRFAEASEVAQRVIKMDPSSVYALTVKALTRALRDDLSGARQAYERMAELDQFGRSVASEGLADLAMYQGDDTQAVQILEDAIERETRDGSMHSVALKQAMRAEALLRLGDQEAAAVALAQALAHSSGDPAVLVSAAVSMIELGDASGAEAVAATLSSRVSRSDRAYAELIRARLLAESGDIPGAIALASGALELADLWLIRAMLAELYLADGQNELAAREQEACGQRVGEGMAVFLNDRPTFRLVAKLDSFDR